jgi:adenine-specific DNA methylase
MKKKVINNDLSKIIQEKHVGKWVAISTNYKKILGYSNTLNELTRKYSGDVVYLKPLSPDMQYSFSN